MNFLDYSIQGYLFTSQDGLVNLLVNLACTIMRPNSLLKMFIHLSSATSAFHNMQLHTAERHVEIVLINFQQNLGNK